MSSVGLDIGGTYLKAAWLDEGPLAVTRRPVPGFLDTLSEAREINPDELMVAVLDLLDEVMGRRKCERIFLTGQMAGLALVDKLGVPMAPLISWQDRRFADIAYVQERIAEEELCRLGDGLRVGLPLVTLAEMNISSETSVTSLLGFVAGSLVGNRGCSLHVTDAAALGLLNIESSQWSEAALDVAGITARQLPRPISAVTVVGRSDFLAADIVVAVGDQQAALLGAGLQPGQVSINIATGCQVSRLTEGLVSEGQLRPYFGGAFLRTVTHLPAGRLLQEAVIRDAKEVSSEPDWQTVPRRAHDSTTAVGKAVEAIADACVTAARQMGPLASSVLFSGGVAQQIPYLRQRICAALDLPYDVFEGDDAAVEGLRALSA